MTLQVNITFANEDDFARMLGFADMEEAKEVMEPATPEKMITLLHVPWTKKPKVEAYVVPDAPKKKHSRWVKGEDNVIETDEYELHDIVSTTYHLPFECQKDGIQNVNEIRLKLAKPRRRYCEGYKWNKDGTPVLNENGERVLQFRYSKKPITMTEKDRALLEKRVNKLLEHMRQVDCWLHDVAEYTC